MGFQSQEPVFVQRARQVANLHMAYQLKYGHPSLGFWAFGTQPQPLSVQSPEPVDQDWHGVQITTVCVTLRYPERWQVRVYLMRTYDGSECWNWKVLRLDSIFPEGGEMTEKVREGKTLYDALVDSYCMRMDDLACTILGRTTTQPSEETVEERRRYRMANGEIVAQSVFYDVVDGGLQLRMPLPAHLSIQPFHAPIGTMI